MSKHVQPQVGGIRGMTVVDSPGGGASSILFCWNPNGTLELPSTRLSDLSSEVLKRSGYGYIPLAVELFFSFFLDTFWAIATKCDRLSRRLEVLDLALRLRGRRSHPAASGGDLYPGHRGVETNFRG